MLLRDGILVPLPAKVITTLLILVRSKGHVVEKDVLMEEVWPNEFVEEGNLAQHIFILRKALGESTDGVRYIETVPRRGYRFLPNVTETDIAAGDASRSAESLIRQPAFRLLAVLPLVNTSQNDHVERLSDNIIESIISALTHFPELRVMAHSTVSHYKDRELDARQVGRELGVHNVLIGTLQSQSDTVVLSVELVDVAGGWRLCGKTYRSKINDILQTQDAIVGEISKAVRISLKGVQEQRHSRSHTENPEAFRAYLRGRYHWNKYTQTGLENAIRNFRQAIEIDPAYALAYDGLADSYIRLSTEHLPPRLTLPKAKAAVIHALEIDPTLAEAHTSLAMLKMRYDWDWNGGESELKKALSLNPNYSWTHQLYGLYFQSQARFDEALHYFRLAQELDPLRLQITVSWGMCYWAMRLYDRSLEKLREVMEMDPYHYPTRLALGVVHGQLGNFSEAIKELKQARQIDGSPPALGYLGYVYAVSGNRAAAEGVLAELRAKEKQRYVSAYILALTHAGLKEVDLAFECLAKACEDRDEYLPWGLGTDPRLDILRTDSRFDELMKLVGLAADLISSRASQSKP